MQPRTGAYKDTTFHNDADEEKKRAVPRDSGPPRHNKLQFTAKAPYKIKTTHTRLTNPRSSYAESEQSGALLSARQENLQLVLL